MNILFNLEVLNLVVDPEKKSILESKVENVKSVNDFNYIVVVGPFQNRSQTNNAREDFRRLNMDSLPPKCREINDELRSIP